MAPRPLNKALTTPWRSPGFGPFCILFSGNRDTKIDQPATKKGDQGDSTTKTFLFILVPILVIGMPFDIALEFLTRFVIPIPNWGIAAEVGFFGIVCMDFMWTVMAAPYLILAAMGIRAMREAA